MARRTAPDTVEFLAPGVQRAAAISMPATTPAAPRGAAPGGVATVSRAIEASGTQAPDDDAGAAPVATDLASLADELYERIEYRLRTSLLLERERRGTLPDL